MSEPVAKRRPMIDLDEFERRLRQPSAASRPAEDDPLAELARLVGSQGDPYKAMFGEEKQTAPTARAAEPGVEADVPPHAQPQAPRDSFASIEDLVLAAHVPLTAAPRDRRGADRDAEAGAPTPSWPEDEIDQGSYGSDYVGEEPRSRRPLYLMAAIVVVGIAGIGASFVLKGARTDPQDIATITAPEGPAKVAVETTTATTGAGRDVTVLEGSQQSQRVGLVDTREQPVDLSQVQDRAPRVTAGDMGKTASGASLVPVPAPPPQVGAPRPQEAPVGLAALIEPRKVKTVSVRPDGTLVPNAPPPAQAADVPLPARRPPAPAVKAATPKIAERAVTTPKPVAAAPAAVEPQAPEKVAAAAPPVSGSYAVQLAAPPSEQEARAIQVRLMKKLGNELAGYHTSIHKAAVGERTVYRVRVGNLSREEAVTLCQSLKSGGTDCFVAKN